MVRTVMTFIAILLITRGSASAQLGTVCVFGDVDGAYCPSDYTPGEAHYYVVHTAHTGAKGVQFAAPMPSCMVGAIYLSDIPMFSNTIGDSQNGVSVGYGACLESPTPVLTIRYWTQGQTTENCAYQVQQHPLFGALLAVDCTDIQVQIPEQTTFINATGGSCGCGASSPPTTVTDTIRITDNGFDPRLVVNWPAPDTITWVNESSRAHTITSGSGCEFNGNFSSPLLLPGETFESVFGQGCYSYFSATTCIRGQYVVQPNGDVCGGPIVSTSSTTWGRIKSLYAPER